MFSQASLLPVFVALYLFPPALIAQTPQPQPEIQKTKTAQSKSEEVDADIAQRRAMGISLLTTLADESRSFKDQTRRARVQARAADILWNTDQEQSRELFKRAWEAAEIADAENARQRAEELQRVKANGGPVVLRGASDIRSEVLRLVAKRDRKLGEEFLKALDEANEKARTEANVGRNSNQLASQSQRLQLARRLAEEGQVQRAMEFAAPALNSVNVDSIFFLSTLREKDAQVADGAFATLMKVVAIDPLSDANTVSGLSSYLFSPFLYVTFEAGGGSNQNRGRGPTPEPNVDPALRTNFLRLGYQILMQPLPAPDQDHSTSGRNGKYLVIKRLLPIFEQYAADLAPGLRTQLTAIASYVPTGLQQEDNRALTSGLMSESNEGDPFQRMQERLDHSKTADERDAIYADYAVALTGKADPRAHDLVDKIENTELRKNVKSYTDFQLTQLAVKNKDVNEIVRLAKSGELSSIQRVWAYTTAAKLIKDSERARAADLLEAALAESRRISNTDPDRARSLTAVATGLADLDPVRSWETLSEIVKAANSAETYTGEDSRISSRLQTPQMMVMTNSTVEEFDLLTLFRQLTRSDVLRSIQVAKGFTGESARAVAMLAIARSLLEKNQNPVATAAK